MANTIIRKRRLIPGRTSELVIEAPHIAVIAVSERGTMYDPGPCVYMEKIAAGPQAADAIDITATPTETVHVICFYPGTLIATPTGEVAVETLERGDLVRVLPDYAQRVDVWAVYPSRLSTSGRLRVCVEFLEKRLVE